MKIILLNYITQNKEGYMKGDITKHITLKFSSTHDLEKEGTIVSHKFNHMII